MLTVRNRLAQARTGTGKTLAFLIPVLQRIINQDTSLETRQSSTFYRREPDIRAIIISPTRELAEQIAVEARRVVSGTSVVVQTAVGGTGKAYGLRRIQQEGCHILVGTPGRLNDILSDPRSGVRVPKLDVLVLDEADRLLDQGFAPEIQAIGRLLPDPSLRDRQTLMFSATVPQEVLQMVRSFMKRDYRFVRTVRANEQQTHERVPQNLVYTQGMESMLPSLLEIMRREQAHSDREPFKAMVFFNANAEASLASAIFKRLRGYDSRKTPIIEMHSRLSQRERTNASQTFRNARSAVMFSSDVSARGMDFPNVTHVIQMGLPRDRDTYIHRLGRTARGDKKGQGWLFITPIERNQTLDLLEDMPLNEDKSLEVPKVDMTQDAQLPANIAACLTEVIEAAKLVDFGLKAEAYKATLGVFQWVRRKGTLLEMMNRRAVYGWGMETPPSIPKTLAVKLGIADVAGVSLKADTGRFDSGAAPSIGAWTGNSNPSGFRSDWPRGRSSSMRGRGEYSQRTSSTKGRGGYSQRNQRETSRFR